MLLLCNNFAFVWELELKRDRELAELRGRGGLTLSHGNLDFCCHIFSGHVFSGAHWN